MQLIAESYDLMKRGLGLSDEELSVVYSDWNKSELNAYLIEITSHIFRKIDERTGKLLVNVILDEAEQNGTGMWTSQDAMAINVPTPVINAAVAMRSLSTLKRERELASGILKVQTAHFEGDKNAFLAQLKGALYASMIITYAQGMAQLHIASKVYAYELNFSRSRF